MTDRKPESLQEGPQGAWSGWTLGFAALLLGGLVLGLLSYALPWIIDQKPGGGWRALVASGLCWWGLVALAGGRSFPATRPRPGALLGLACALLVLRWVASLAAPELSDDVYRYVWEGDLVAQGQSPYVLAPADPGRAAQAERMPWVLASMNHPEVSAAYPMGIQLVLGGMMAGAPPGELAGVGVRRMRWFFGLADLAVLLPLLAILRRRGLPWGRALIWGASPLAIVEFAGSGHFDSLGILTLVGALACLPERPRREASVWEAAGMLLFTWSVWIKLLPLMLAPFVLRGPGWRRRLAWMVAGSLLCHLPLLWLEGGAGGLLRGLATYGARWEGGSLLYRWLFEGARGLGLGHGVAAGLGRGLALAALLAVMLGLWRRRVSALDSAPLLLGTFALFTPMLHPWYLAWLVPCLAWSRSLAWAWLPAMAACLYAPLANYRQGGVWEEPVWVWASLALPFAGLALWDRRARRAVPSG